ncbi:MAG: hypothetical protein QNJ46_00560 [Leptolyngbyaceae cyanobacterium MO_188.B28]|nr:hypothetical protein [Leptolyngbyaceae cyanobacterium MO_188.B28]
MDSLQAQVSLLTDKVDSLHQIIDQINTQITDVLSVAKQEGENPRFGVSPPRQFAYSSRESDRSLNGALEHKDVLIDNDYLDLEKQGAERDLSPEIQIQRLTAQLTAAYNRIAALEEQLLAQRVH